MTVSGSVGSVSMWSGVYGGYEMGSIIDSDNGSWDSCLGDWNRSEFEEDEDSSEGVSEADLNRVGRRIRLYWSAILGQGCRNLSRSASSRA